MNYTEKLLDAIGLERIDLTLEETMKPNKRQTNTLGDIHVGKENGNEYNRKRCGA